MASNANSNPDAAAPVPALMDLPDETAVDDATVDGPTARDEDAGELSAQDSLHAFDGNMAIASMGPQKMAVNEGFSAIASNFMKMTKCLLCEKDRPITDFVQVCMLPPDNARSIEDAKVPGCMACSDCGKKRKNQGRMDGAGNYRCKCCPLTIREFEKLFLLRGKPMPSRLAVRPTMIVSPRLGQPGNIHTVETLMEQITQLQSDVNSERQQADRNIRKLAIRNSVLKRKLEGGQAMSYDDCLEASRQERKAVGMDVEPAARNANADESDDGAEDDNVDPRDMFGEEGEEGEEGDAMAEELAAAMAEELAAAMEPAPAAADGIGSEVGETDVLARVEEPAVECEAAAAATAELLSPDDDTEAGIEAITDAVNDPNNLLANPRKKRRTGQADEGGSSSGRRATGRASGAVPSLPQAASETAGSRAGRKKSMTAAQKAAAARAKEASEAESRAQAASEALGRPIAEGEAAEDEAGPQGDAEAAAEALKIPRGRRQEFKAYIDSGKTRMDWAAKMELEKAAASEHKASMKEKGKLYDNVAKELAALKVSAAEERKEKEKAVKKAKHENVAKLREYHQTIQQMASLLHHFGMEVIDVEAVSNGEATAEALASKYKRPGGEEEGEGQGDAGSPSAAL